MGELILSHFGYNPYELVPRNGAPPQHRRVVYLKGRLLMTFNFEDRFERIDDVLQEVKVEIFRILQDPLELVQPDWST